MKRFLLIGKTGSGKTSLLQRLYGLKMVYQKTQTAESVFASVDTPGEYLEQKRLYSALIVTAADCDELLLVQAADDPDSSFPPGLAASFNRSAIGVVTKMDLAQAETEAARAAECLREAGAARVYFVSAKTGEGLAALRAYVTETAPAV